MLTVHKSRPYQIRNSTVPVFFSVRTLEKAKATGNYAADQSELQLHFDNGFVHDSESDTSDSESTRSSHKSKKLKVSKYS